MPTTSTTTLAPYPNAGGNHPEDDLLDSLIQIPRFPQGVTVKDKNSIVDHLIAAWVTRNEVQFIRDLCQRGRIDHLLRHADIILNDRRVWDEGVDVQHIKSECRIRLERAGYAVVQSGGTAEILAL